MITVLTGENGFAIHEALQALIRDFSGQPERVDGTTLELRQLPDLLMGGTLFAEDRLIIIRGISENTALKTQLVDWLDRVDSSIHLVLIDEKLDKRTALYKELKKKAILKDFPAWGERDTGAAIQWVQKQAPKLDRALADHLVRRVGLDQWQLASSLDILANLDEITLNSIDEHIEPNQTENVFQLFELALEGRPQRIFDMLRTLELSEDAYSVFALLSSQAYQLAAVGLAESGDAPTKDAAIHPFVASKLERHARRLGPRGVLRILSVFADADADLKRSRGEPWLVIEKSLLQIVQ
jgi:DNA polymerase III delta subunit